MPNWCQSTLSVAGPTDAIERLFEAVASDDGDVHGKPSVLDFQRILPMPEELRDLNVGGAIAPDGRRVRVWRTGPDGTVIPADEEELRAKYGHDNWYDWANEHWGCKWPAYETRRRGYAIDFETAWAPPRPVIQALSEQHPRVTLTLQYWEPGNAFGGRIVFRGGGERSREEWRGTGICLRCGDEWPPEDAPKDDDYTSDICDVCATELHGEEEAA